MHIKDTFIQWFENNPFQLAAALANYTLFSMASTFVDCALNCRLSVRARSFRYMKTARARTNLLASSKLPSLFMLPRLVLVMSRSCASPMVVFPAFETHSSHSLR
jgi:hypothetical protein